MFTINYFDFSAPHADVCHLTSLGQTPNQKNDDLGGHLIRIIFVLISSSLSFDPTPIFEH